MEIANHDFKIRDETKSYEAEMRQDRKDSRRGTGYTEVKQKSKPAQPTLKSD